MNTQTQQPLITSQQSKPTGIRGQRGVAVAAPSVAAATTWVIANNLLGVDVAAPSFDPANPAMEVGIGSVIASTAIATLLGWALLVILERAIARPKVVWTAAAVGFALISLAGPLSGTGVTASQRLVPVAFHLMVAAVYVPLMRRTIPRPTTS